jgi:hypothetical protein
MVGMGSVVTKSVPDFHLVLGNPARSVGAVCRCGQVVSRFDGDGVKTCPACQRGYAILGTDVAELDPPEVP